MKKMSLSDVKAYDAPGHFGVSTMRLHGKDETGGSKFWMGLSHFLPGGGCDLGVPPGEKVYYVLEGEITIKNETHGDFHRLTGDKRPFNGCRRMAAPSSPRFSGEFFSHR